MNNHSVYADKELKNWTERSGLLEQEYYLIEKYISDHGRLIEAGTGGGRISLEIEQRYNNLHILAFDFVEEMIQSAKRKSNKIDFRVLDASDLSMIEDESFDFAVYLQQITSLVPESLISKVLEEAYRTLKKDGVILFSFLYYQGRGINPILSFMVNIFRWIRSEKRNKKRLPWLKLGGKVNMKLFNKHQATTYWFEEDEIKIMLENTGFQILEIKKDNMLYVVCQK